MVIGWPLPLRRSEKSPLRHASNGTVAGRTGCVARAGALLGEEEEGPILAVVQLRDRDRAAERAAELISLKGSRG